MGPNRHAPPVPPMAAIAVAVVAVSTSAILVRYSAAPSLVKAFYRVVFTLAIIAPVALLRSRGQIARLEAEQFLAAAATGIALAIHFAAWFESLAWTSVAASVTLVQSQPVFVAIGAVVLLNERLGRRRLLGIVVAVVGMAVMTLPGDAAAGARPALGNGLAIIGAIAAAAYVLAGRSLRQAVPLVPYVTVVYAACALGLLGLLLGGGTPLFGYPPREWVLFLGMAIGPGILGHTLINWALRHVESSVVSVSLLGEPVGSTLLAVVLLGEVPAAITVAGAVVVVGGIYLTVRDRG